MVAFGQDEDNLFICKSTCLYYDKEPMTSASHSPFNQSSDLRTPFQRETRETN
jgi:hypothetical protein